MIKEDEKRHSTAGITTSSPGVGGRQPDPPPSPRGGGYQDNCTVLNFAQKNSAKKCDPRLDELREMGLQRVWLEVAENIGVDAFLQVWRILDADASNMADDGRRLVPMRSYSCYERYQRNRYIEALDALGFTHNAIRDRLQHNLGEKLSTRHISRFSKRAKLGTV